MTYLVASIPSPSSGVIEIGGFPLIHAYGLCIGVGMYLAVLITARRFRARGGDPDEIWSLAPWCLVAGVVGARLYHVATDWKRFTDEPLNALKIWEGGLGIWGGVALGTVVGLWLGRKRGFSIGLLAECAAPAIPLAQAIGRIGNYFNQELFGKPSDLPWALEIDFNNRPPLYQQFATFHPTFLYELLWNLGVVAIILMAENRFRVRRARLFCVYVASYTFGRFWIERMRIDDASHVLGLRINELVSLAVFFAALLILLYLSSKDDSADKDHDGDLSADEPDHGVIAVVVDGELADDAAPSAQPADAAPDA